VFIFHFTKLDLHLKQSEPNVVAQSKSCDLPPSKLADDLILPTIADPQNVILI
jgi:hypothetical protein